MYYYMTGFVINFTVSIVSTHFLFHRTNNLLINLIEFILFSLEQSFFVDEIISEQENLYAKL